MANYYESARSNYFIVKDVDAFTAELKGTGLEISTKDVDGVTLVCLLADVENGFPQEKYDPETYDSEELDWADIFKRHLVDNQVAVIVGAGAEKLRYVNGWTVAYNNKGESVSINLEDIYEKAKTLGSNITHASY
jgi:hypothetical protein